MKSLTALLFIAALLTGCEEPKDEDDEASGGTGTSQHYTLVTGDNSRSSREIWDKFFDRPEYVYGKDPIPFLRDNVDLVKPGRALVVAMGEGRNAVFLARRGFSVDGVDISDVAVRKARRLAKEFDVTINAEVASLRDYVIKPNYYDIIVNAVFFRDTLVPVLKRGLKKGGIILFENYTEEHPKIAGSVAVTPKFLVRKGQLRTLFKDFEILKYSETVESDGAYVRLIARKI